MCVLGLCPGCSGGRHGTGGRLRLGRSSADAWHCHSHSWDGNTSGEHSDASRTYCHAAVQHNSECGTSSRDEHLAVDRRSEHYAGYDCDPEYNDAGHHESEFNESELHESKFPEREHDAWILRVHDKPKYYVAFESKFDDNAAFHNEPAAVRHHYEAAFVVKSFGVSECPPLYPADPILSRVRFFFYFL